MIVEKVHNYIKNIFERNKSDGTIKYDWSIVYATALKSADYNNHGFISQNDNIPTLDLIQKYREYGLNDVFGEDGILFYTEDSTIITERNMMFMELSEKNQVFNELDESFKIYENLLNVISETDNTRSDMLKYICSSKKYVDMFCKLVLSDSLIKSESVMLKKLYVSICNVVVSDRFLKFKKLLDRIPDNYSDVRSITFTLNLDSGFSPCGIRIDSINSNTSNNRHMRRNPSTSSGNFSFAVLNYADRYLSDELKFLRTDIKKELDIPVKFIGVGEKLDDMQSFSSKEFVEALFE